MIAVLWKPKAFSPLPFKVKTGSRRTYLSFPLYLLIHFFVYPLVCVPLEQTSQMVARRVEVSGEEAHTVPNVEAILEDFRVMGQGLVKSVEPRMERWVV